jgi:hypothetical protein
MSGLFGGARVRAACGGVAAMTVALAVLAFSAGASIAAGPAPDPAPDPAPAPVPATTQPSVTTPPASTPAPQRTYSPPSSYSTPPPAASSPSYSPSSGTSSDAAKARAAKERAKAKAELKLKARNAARAKAAAKARAAAKAKQLALQAQVQKQERAPFTPPVAAGGLSSTDVLPSANVGGNSTLPLMVLLLAVGATMLLLGSIPTTTAFSVGPRVGHAVVRGRPALLTVGIALALGALAALCLGASL